MSLPGVAELLRPVGPGPASDSGRQASGREAHPQKITVYLSADEFLDLERARLALRARGIGVDRGRLVREAIALLIMDLETGIDVSTAARRLGAGDRPGQAGTDPAPVSGVLAGGTRGALAVGAFVNGPPADGGPQDRALGNGALVTGALANGASGNGDLGRGGLVTGVLANGAPADGVPAAGALADAGPAAAALVDGGPLTGALADAGLVAGAPAGAQ